MKISVYAIAKNESKFCERWIASMSEADEVVVLDTGSTDDTVEKLRRLGAKVVQEEISPWRFDAARNRSMELVSPDADILVCTDLDELFSPHWRARLEKVWNNAMCRGIKPTTARYKYVWNVNADGTDGVTFLYEKIHAPRIAKWTHPVHEIIDYGETPKTVVDIPDVCLRHYADPWKSRAGYLPLLELAVKESPEDDRNMHYLGREYMFAGRWDDAISTFYRHLSLRSSGWDAERAASMRFTARCFGEKGLSEKKELWLMRAIDECPTQREAALELARHYLDVINNTSEGSANAPLYWKLIIKACEKCVSIKKRELSYLTSPEAWGAEPWDLYSLALWYVGRREEALSKNAIAISLAPHDKRLQQNKECMETLMGIKKVDGEGKK